MAWTYRVLEPSSNKLLQTTDDRAVAIDCNITGFHVLATSDLGFAHYIPHKGELEILA